MWHTPPQLFFFKTKIPRQKLKKTKKKPKSRLQQNPLPFCASFFASAVPYGSASPLPLRSHIQAKQICFLLPTNAAATPLAEIVAEVAGTIAENGVAIKTDENDAPTSVFDHGSSDFCNESGERCGSGISRQEEADFFGLNVRPKRQRRCRAVQYC